MKKYIFILLSFGLFSLPLGALAQVDVSACTSATTEDMCIAGCEWGRDNTTCTICQPGTYSTDGIYGCKDCYIPSNAKFIKDNKYAGMTDPHECPWEVSVCDENKYLDPAKITWKYWKDETELTKKDCIECDEGHYADNTTQTWENYSLSNPCKPKTYKIHAYIYLPKDCGNKSQELTFNYKYDSTMPDIYEKVTSEITDHEFPIVPNTTFKLYPIEQNVDQEMTLRWDGNTLGFNADDGSKTKIGRYPNNAEFYIEIEMTEKNPILIYYCISQFENAGTSLEKCGTPFQYDKCNKPTAPKLSNNSIFGNLGLPNCSKGQYADSWKLLHPANNKPGSSIDWAASNNKVIKFDETIDLPTDTVYRFFYMAPNFKDCQSGTYNNNVKCPTECSQCTAGTFSASGASECSPCPAGTFSASGASKCENCAAGKFSASGASECSDCPDGFITASGVAASKTDCYINTTMTFIDNNNNKDNDNEDNDNESVTILKSPVYYVGNQ